MIDSDVTTLQAQLIIHTLGATGNPPQYGVLHFTVGLDKILRVINSKYLVNLIKNGGSSFKVVEAPYGEGKTHFLFCIRELAWQQEFITSYITLSPQKTPFYKWVNVYKELVSNLMYAQDPGVLLQGRGERGISSIISMWVATTLNDGIIPNEVLADKKHLKKFLNNQLYQYPSKSFRNAIINAFISKINEEDEDFDLLIQWLEGVNVRDKRLKEHGIYQELKNDQSIKHVIQSLIQWLKDIGYSGLVVLLDEAELNPSLKSKDKDILLSNLRELIDDCHTGSYFQNSMWFYAIPDLMFIEDGESGVYEALKQRLRSKFIKENGTIYWPGIVINLETIDSTTILKEIGHNIARLFFIAYDITSDQSDFNLVEEIVSSVIEELEEMGAIRQTGLKRLFIQRFINQLDSTFLTS